MSQKQLITKEDLFSLLQSFDYFNYFESQIIPKNYNINYGKKRGEMKATGIKDVAEKYLEPNFYPISDARIQKWQSVLSNPLNQKSDAVLLEILDILDWGHVWNGNINRVISLYRENKLSVYLEQINQFLKEPKLIDTNVEFDVLMSSGWTKIYSYTFNSVLIYDSRVSAFLNYTLLQSFLHLKNNSNLNSNDLSTIESKFNQVCSYLYNFGGGTGENSRLRQLKVEYFRKKSQPENNRHGFNANIISTWIAELILENTNLKNEKTLNTRSMERIFFMLGFDLKQLPK